MEEKSETKIDKYLDNSYGSKLKVPEIIPKWSKRKSKIEMAGKTVMNHLVELASSTDLGYSAMAKRVNELYRLDITKQNVIHFFRTNLEALDKLSGDQETLGRMRARLHLEHNKILVKDIKILDNEIVKLLGDEGNMMEADRRAKAVGDLIDKKGRLLLRHAKLSGKLKDVPNTTIEKMQQNIFMQVNDQKSELIQRLKKVEFKKVETPSNEDKNKDS